MNPDTFITPAQLEVICAIVRGEGKIVIAGPTQTGKTSVKAPKPEGL